MRKDVHVRISVKFRKTLDTLYPDIKSIRIKTEKLSNDIEEIFYGKKK